jgi:hypothetical protein
MLLYVLWRKQRALQNLGLSTLWSWNHIRCETAEVVAAAYESGIWERALKASASKSQKLYQFDTSLLEARSVEKKAS